MDDYQEPPEPTIEEERDYYKRERNRLQSELATAQKEISELREAAFRSDDTIRNSTENVRKLCNERDSLTRQLQTAMEERDALIAAAKCQNEFEVLVEKESYKNLRPDEAKRMEELQAVMNKAADIVEPMTPPADLLSRLSTSRSTENKT